MVLVFVAVSYSVPSTLKIAFFASSLVTPEPERPSFSSPLVRLTSFLDSLISKALAKPLSFEDK